MKKALLVGIDNYNQCKLNGCVEDVLKLERLFSLHHDFYPNFDCKMIIAPIDEPNLIKDRKSQDTPETITTEILMKHISELFKHETETAILYFSGHGYINEFGGFLVSQNGTMYDAGVRMVEIMHVIKKAVEENLAKEILVILDCCHSGLFGNPTIHSVLAEIPKGVTVIAACEFSELATGDLRGGYLTKGISNALNGGAADPLGDITAMSIYNHLVGSLAYSWSNQKFVFRTNITENFRTIRKCKPEYEYSILKILPDMFSDLDCKFQLLPNMIHKDENGNESIDLIVNHLLQLLKLGIIDICGEQDIIYAAKNSCICQLTPLGKYFLRIQRNAKT